MAEARMPDPSRVERPWLAAYPPGVPATYRWPEVPLTRLLDDAARDLPHLAAVEADGAAWSWGEAHTLADRVAAGLARLGVTPGDRVALALPNGPAAVAVAFGTWRAGAVLLLLDPDLPVPVRDAVLAATTPTVTVTVAAQGEAWPDDAGAVVVTTPDDWRPTGRLGRLRARWGRRRGGRHAEGADRPGRGARLAWDQFVADPPADGWPGVGPDDVAVLAPTGGTTGHRRLVTLTHRNLVANAFQARLWVPDVQAGRERLLAATPFTHPFGLTVGLLAGTLSAATLVVPDDVSGPTLRRTIARARPTLFPAVPALVRAIVDATDEPVDLSSLRVCLVGGAPLPPGVAARYRAMSGQGRLREGYGVSEAGPLTHANPVYGRSHQGRGGLPVTGTVSIVVDEDDPTVVLEPGRVGRLAIAGPQVMPGYFRDPEGTAAVLRDGWLLTGDLAVVDAAGHVAIVDRAVDVVVTSAGSVFPGDVEAVLAAHPAVTAAQVTARPRVDGTDEVVAAVVLGDATVGVADALMVHCRSHLPPHAVPAGIDLVDALAPRDGEVVRTRTARQVADADEEVAG